MKRTSILTAIALIGSAASVRAQADFISLETQTQSATYGGAPGQEKIGILGSLGISSTTGGTATSAGCSVNVTGTVANPVTMLNATVDYAAGNGFYAYTEATAELVYTVTVNGPPNTSATIGINFSINEPGGEGPAYAAYGGFLDEIAPGGSVAVDPGTGDSTITGSYTQLYSTGYNYGNLTTGPSTPILVGTGVFSESYTVSVGTIFLLALDVDAASDRSTDWSPGFPPAGSYGAVIDPAFKVDPSTPNASAYSLEYPAAIQPPSVPNLIIVPNGAGGVQLQWPATGTYILEQTTNLAGGVWTTNTSSLTTANGTNSLTLASPIGSQYFRLEQ